MRIWQVSTSDIQGGAERVAWNLFTACRARGHDSRMAVGVKRSGDPDVLVIPNEASRGRWARSLRGLSSRFEGEDGPTPLSRIIGIASEPRRRLDYFRGVEDFHYPGTAHLLELDAQSPDLLHLHNLHGAYFDLRMLPALSRKLPVVLTLHDAWLLSGHCSHSFECERWRIGCGDCPDLTIYPSIERDATAHNWKRKREIFLQTRMFVSTPSRWLLDKVQQSMLVPAIAEARVIPNGVDLKVFHPDDRAEARARLEIPQDARVLLTARVGARDSRWTDLETLREAVLRVARSCPGDKILLIVLGDDAPGERPGTAEVRFRPFVSDASEVAGYYQAADVYVHPSRADTFPLTVLESMACGTPVVATATGGIPEQVEDCGTGFLVQPGDADGMAARIRQLLQDEACRTSLRRRAAAHARQTFSLDRQVQTYLDWYAQIRSHPSTALMT